jgi:Cytochrome c3
VKMPARRIVWIAIAVVVAIASAGAAIALWPHPPRNPAPGAVPAAWAQFRTSPGHQTHVAKADIACGACHNFERDGFKNPGTDVCRNCHAKEAAVAHRGGAGTAATPCLSCHAFAPDLPKPTCIGCHAKAQGESLAVVRHATLECAQCHKVHESPSVVAADCASCHRERAPEHAAHAGSTGCLDCHGGHAPAVAALDTCATCHAQAHGPPPPGHESCVGCHQPHDFVAGGETACVRCHGQKTTLAAETTPAHAVCTSCHLPHAPANAAAACIGCHADVHVAHGKEGACVSCHQPHTDDPRLVTSTCTSCHTKVAGVDTGAHAGGVACEACHKPHAFAPVDAKTLCVSCHMRETTLVASNPGHQACASCHGASASHAPTKAPACGTCHAKEQASAPAGHQRCQECHDPHAGEPTPTCATCHKNETTGIHAAVAGGCATCHRPHGPEGIASPPSCASCHAAATLPALHAVPGHAVCSSCHVAPHEPPRADRVTCTGTCHTDKRDHQPKATVCAGCHVFRR